MSEQRGIPELLRLRRNGVLDDWSEDESLAIKSAYRTGNIALRHEIRELFPAEADEADDGGLLTAENVERTFHDCLAENPDSVTTLAVDGIVHNAAFDRAKLADHHDSIGKMLSELPVEFQASGGGGWSFLNACNDRHGRQWTGLHLTMEQLFLLGIATDQANYVLPRGLWNVLPGGMPYIAVSPKAVGV